MRGVAMSTPVHRMAAVLRTRPGVRPSVPSMAALAPPAALSAKMPTHESTTSTKMKHANPTSHSLPLVMPR